MLIVHSPWDAQPQCGIAPAEAWNLNGLWFPGGAYPTIATLQTNVSIDVGINGLTWTNAAATNAAVILFSNSTMLPLTQATVILGGNTTTTAVNGDIGVNSATTTHRLGAHLPYTDNKVYWDFGGTGVGTTRLVTTGTVTRSENDVWALTTGPRGMEIWQNGLLIASNTAQPTRSVSTAEWGLGPQGLFSGTRPAGKWWMVGLSSRQAPTALLQKLTSPKAAFAELVDPIHRYIPISITSGGTYTLNLETGSYSFTGSDAVLLKNSQLTLDSGSYSLTGSNASLLKGLILEASSGTYTLSGSDASLLYTHLLSASSDTYTINGADATLTYTPASGTYTLNAESGTYLLTGSDVTFIYSGSEVTIKAGSWIRYRIIT